MTKQAVLDLCHQAYRSLKSYHGTTEVETRDVMREGGTFPTPPELSEPPSEVRRRSSAEIWYASPSLLRIEGNLSHFVWEAEDDPYAIVCDGSNTWARWSVTEQEWEKEESASMAIGGFTGVSGGACTTIPSLLLGEWSRFPIMDATLEAEAVDEDGRPAWRVHSLTDVGEVTYWVDQASGFLLRMRTLTNLARLHNHTLELHRRLGLKVPDHYDEPDVDMEEFIAMDTTEVFTVISCNEDLPESLFARPDGAPE